MAPERLDGQAGGPAVDVYATAALAFEMLSGRKAVTGKTAMEVARRVIEAPAPDLAEVVPGTPRRAAEALKRGMAKAPAERPATVGELVRELSAAYADEARPAAAAKPAPTARPASAAMPPTAAPVVTPPSARRGRPRRRGWLAPALLAAALAAVLAVVLLSGGDDGKPTRAASKPAPKQRARSATSKKGAPATGQPSSPAPIPAAPPGTPPATPSSTPAATPSAPAKTLTSFYTLAANDDFQGAWALGTDNLHAQFNGSVTTFRGTLATLKTISFPTLETTSQTATAASVRFSSIATHTNRTDHCSGTASLVKGGGRWLLDHIGVNCAP
jgi:serine/threonine-protein kinase